MAPASPVRGGVLRPEDPLLSSITTIRALAAGCGQIILNRPTFRAGADDAAAEVIHRKEAGLKLEVLSTLHDPDPEFESRASALLLDVLIRAGLVLALAVLCFQVFSPFLSLMTWALILAVTLYPLQQSVAARSAAETAATLLVLLGIVVVIVPTAALMNSLGDSVHRLIHDVQNNTLRVPPPRAGVAEWPLVGEQVHAFWTKAHENLPALVQSMQPKIGNLATVALGFVAGIGSGLLQFLASRRRRHHDGLRRRGGTAIRSILGRVAGQRERNSSTWPPRPSARSPRECSASRSCRPSSSASACSSPASRGQACWQSSSSCSASRRCRR